MKENVVRIYKVTMPDKFGSARLRYQGFVFDRNSSPSHTLKLSDSEVRSFKMRRFTVDLASDFVAPESGPRRIKLKDATDEELSALLVEKNMAIPESREDKIEELRKSGVAFAKREN